MGIGVDGFTEAALEAEVALEVVGVAEVVVVEDVEEEIDEIIDERTVKDQPMHFYTNSPEDHPNIHQQGQL